MSVYRPSYRDTKTGKLKKQDVWWYKFSFAGRHIRESSKSKRKTVAIEAEKQRRLELERGFNNIADTRRERIRSVAELADEFFEGYKLRNPKSATFAEYAIGHVKRLLGKVMSIDVADAAVTGYQTARLKEDAAAKSINEEVGFLLRILDEHGDAIRAKLKRKGSLKLKVARTAARAFSVADKVALLAEAKKRRSPSVYAALMLALHCGLRDAELRGLTWGLVDFDGAEPMLTVGDSKTEAGEGRTIPLNTDVLVALTEHRKWFLKKFSETRAEWYVFPFGKPQPTDPTRSVTSFKTVWTDIRKETKVSGRWHDSRHTFVTDLAESAEASDETIRSLAGHVSKQMLKHYSHIRMQAKRRAVAALEAKPAPAAKPEK